MAAPPPDLPTLTQLREGCLIASIVHGIMVTRFPEVSHEQTWDGENYNIQDSMGSRGTISFQQDVFCAAFFDAESPRNPEHSGKPPRASEFLLGAPVRLVHLATSETFQYLLQEWKGEPTPIITAAFWGFETNSAACEPWKAVFKNGARLISRQMLDRDAALAEWKLAYEMSDSEITLARNLVDLRLVATGPITLTDVQRSQLEEAAETGGGMDESRESLAEIQIVV